MEEYYYQLIKQGIKEADESSDTHKWSDIDEYVWYASFMDDHQIAKEVEILFSKESVEVLKFYDLSFMILKRYKKNNALNENERYILDHFVAFHHITFSKL